MNLQIMPGTLKGAAPAPVSKSAAHRAVVCAALASGFSTLSPLPSGVDVAATLEAVRFLGAEVAFAPRLLRIQGGAYPLPPSANISCRDSASTLRLLLPAVAALGIPARFYGTSQLVVRPIDHLIDELGRHGARIVHDDLVISLSGRLRPGTYRMVGDVSSQYISGLLLALPLLEADSEVICTTPLHARDYVEMTVRTLAHFGVEVHPTAEGYHVPGRQRLRSCNTVLEGDYSCAANWFCANLLGGSVEVTGLNADSVQADRVAQELFAQLAASRLFEYDCSDVPDLFPLLCVAAAYTEGESRLTDRARQNYTENERPAAMADALRALGAQVREIPAGLVIEGRAALPGGCTVDSRGDHRVAMALAIAALRCVQPVTLTGTQCVEKSYPAFWNDFAMLGGVCSPA